MRGGPLRVFAKTLLQTLSGISGYNPLQTWSGFRGVPRFVRDAGAYARQAAPASLRLRFRDLYPVCTDFDADAGTVSGHYFHQDLWAARKIHARAPKHHVDIGSRLDGFVAHLLVFMPVDVVDVRPLRSSVVGLQFIQSDALRLNEFETDSLDSVSSLHAVEHFGLGRYGDAVAPDACFAAMSNMRRVLKPGGHLYFAVPIGRERLEFNAHRVFAPDTILQHFSELSLVSFSAVNDGGDYCEECSPADFSAARFACGLYEFTKERA